MDVCVYVSLYLCTMQLLLSTGQTPNDGHNHKLGTSEEIFVHNNSKHGRLSINKQAPTSSDVMADSK